MGHSWLRLSQSEMQVEQKACVQGNTVLLLSNKQIEQSLSSIDILLTEFCSNACFCSSTYFTFSIEDPLTLCGIASVDRVKLLVWLMMARTELVLCNSVSLY